MIHYNNDSTKIFYILGQLYKSRYVSQVLYTNQEIDFGYCNIILNSGSSIHLPNKESLIELIFKDDWFEPVTTI